MKHPKKRLDILLYELGFAETQKKAEALVISGSVSVDGVIVTKPGTPVSKQSKIALIKKSPYVSRGGLKLESAAKKLNISFEGRICMDVGASTGGFTDFLLQHGAKKVYAVDVGKNLLHEKIKNDPRVINIENTNFRYFSIESLKEPIEFVTIDTSFISLEKILPKAAECLKENGEILAMVKPQFEASPNELIKGVVKSEAIRLNTIEKIKNIAKNLSLQILGEADSDIKGPEGNIEHFLWMKKQ